MQARAAGRLAALATAVLAVLGTTTASYTAAATTSPDSLVAVSTPSLAVQQGQSVATTVLARSVDGRSGSVSLRTRGLPADATASLAWTLPLSTSSPTATPLTVRTARSTPPGTYRVVVDAVSGRTASTAVLTLTVKHTLGGAFSLSAPASAGTVAPGDTAAATVQLSAGSGFAGPVTLRTSGQLPAGITSATFTQSTLDLTSARTTGVSSLQLVTSPDLAPGRYPVELVGTGRGADGAPLRQHARTVLTVRTGGSPVSVLPVSSIGSFSPGSWTAVDMLLTNPSPEPVTVTNLTVRVRSTSAGAACPPRNLAVRQFSEYPVTLPAHGSATLYSLVGRAGLPVLRMLELPGGQRRCHGVDVALDLSGSAHVTSG
ncbi:MAG: hypothetical protein M3P93_12455 [Actinomycetota bacterium]|nr:hypothetical protein [Actinomycetota bacterium]